MRTVPNFLRRSMLVWGAVLLGSIVSAAQNSGSPSKYRPCEPWLEPNICAAWTQMVADVLQLRVAVSTDQCPEILKDGTPKRMKLRAAADYHFPAVCQLDIDKDTKSLTLSGRSLSVPPAVVNKVAIFGDTGCRIKNDEKKGEIEIQACNDPYQWPFEQLADLAANKYRPDLVLHVGDYYYRESKCPEDEPGCKDSPWGDRWESWNKDFFEPARQLLEAAPWIFVRGNHEDCKRGGKGWMRFFAPENADKLHLGCQESTKEINAIHLEGLNLYALDSAEAVDDSAPPEKVRAIVDQLKQVKEDLLKQKYPHGWILVHHPFWGLKPKPPKLLEVNQTEQAAWHTFEGPDPLPGLDLILSGHIHEFSSLSFPPKENLPGQRPAQWIVGSGGDRLEVTPPYRPPSPPPVIDGMKVDLFLMEAFGFLLLDRKPKFWQGTLLNAKNDKLAECCLNGRSLSCSEPASPTNERDNCNK